MAIIKVNHTIQILPETAWQTNSLLADFNRRFSSIMPLPWQQKFIIQMPQTNFTL